MKAFEMRHGKTWFATQRLFVFYNGEYSEKRIV